MQLKKYFLTLFLAGLVPVSSFAQKSSSELDELNRRMEILAGEIEKLKVGDVAVKADQMTNGLAPAASKIYRVNQGLSIGGYGEIIYKNPSSKKQNGSASGLKDTTDALRAVLYVGYKLNDKFLINTEFEFEHAGANAQSSGSGYAGAEFAFVDYLHDPKFNLRAGLLLVPMGFVNELHEPTIFLGVNRPDIENKIIPTTWRENGLGVWGDISNFSYKAYLVNGFKGDGFTASGLRNGRQKGAESIAEDFALVARLDYTPFEGSLMGVAAYYGGSDQGAIGNNAKADSKTKIYDFHVEWKKNGFETRFLGVLAKNSGVRSLNAVKAFTGSQSIGEELRGFYLQFGYDFLQGAAGEAFIPFIRYSDYDTQYKVPVLFSRNPANDVREIVAGFSFKPHQNIVVKFDYENERNAAKTGVDYFNAGFGFNF